MIRIEVNATEVPVGGRVTGRAVWTSDGGKHPRKIEVTWRRRVEGKVTAHTDLDSATAENTDSMSQIVVPFDFGVQLDSAVSFTGKTFHLIWELVATADMPWARDESDTKVITIKPAAWTLDEYKRWCEAGGLYADDGDEDEDEDEDEDDEDVNESSPGTRPESR